MAIQAHMSVKGKVQGQFKGEAAAKGPSDQWIPIVGFTMGMKSPRDLATGQASGKRQYDPVTIVKAWGAASPQALTACATNEVLSSVTIEFLKSVADGKAAVYQTITLTDATLSQVARYTGDSSAPAALESWSFTFSKIQVADKDGDTTFLDEWQAARV